MIVLQETGLFEPRMVKNCSNNFGTARTDALIPWRRMHVGCVMTLDSLVCCFMADQTTVLDGSDERSRGTNNGSRLLERLAGRVSARE